MTTDTPDTDRLEDALAEALSGRAAAVTATASSDARAAVDRRIGRRARARRTRRALAATAAAVAVVVLVAAAVVLGSDGGGEPEVATDAGDQVTTTAVAPDYEVGATTDNPANFGLPLIGFDDRLGMTLDSESSAVATVAPTGPSLYDYTQIQAFRPRGAATPVILAPWPAPAATSPGLQSSESGWLTLSWTLEDGTPAQLFSFGVEADDLQHFAEGLRRDRNGRGYLTGDLPDGFYAERYATPAADTPTARYELTYQRRGVNVRLEVRRESGEGQEERLIQALAGALTAENVDVLGHPGIAVSYGQIATVAWAHGQDVTANLVVTGPSDAEVQAAVNEVVAGLRELTPDRWFDAVSRSG